jgi:hypothetical protein
LFPKYTVLHFSLKLRDLRLERKADLGRMEGILLFFEF